MKLNDLRSPGSTKAPKRLGRGIGSGIGKTSGKGHKGQNARSGGGVRPGFEGGQMPLVRRLPKVGFTNNFKKEYTTVNVAAFDKLKENTKITAELLKEEGIISKIAPYGIKVLGSGEVKKAFTVVCAKITKSAEEKILNAGGKVEVK